MLKDFFSVPVYIHNFNYDTNLLSKSCFQYMTDNREVIEKKAGQDIKSIYDLQLTWVKDEIKVNTEGFGEPKYSISNSYKLDNIDVWNNLLSDFEKHANEFVKNFYDKKLKISEFWVNVSRKNNFVQPHVHPKSVFTGVYYIQSSENCGDLRMENPFATQLQMTGELKPPYTKYNTSYWKFPPIENRLYLFHSWLRHSVEVNYSDVPRLSLSFNMVEENVVYNMHERGFTHKKKPGQENIK